jgi:hypothetical protein
MQTVSIPKIIERLQNLSPDQLARVYDFVSYLANKGKFLDQDGLSDALQTMFASEAILRVDWERPEEDDAWASL